MKEEEGKKKRRGGSRRERQASTHDKSTPKISNLAQKPINM
jgi:hypothetical protein